MNNPIDQNKFEELVKNLSAEQFIFIAKLIRKIEGPVQCSFPPIRHYTLQFENFSFYRSTNIGDKRAIESITINTRFRFIDSSMDGIALKENSKYVVGARRSNETNDLIIGVCMETDGELTQLCMEIVSVPAGWVRQIGGGWIYPVKDFSKQPIWITKHTDPNELRCIKTRRPALLCKDDRITMLVEQIIPSDAEKRMAPYGDGKFKITVTNNDKQNKITIPAILVDSYTKKISWEDSIIIIDAANNRPYCPNDAFKRDNLVSLVLEPGSSICTVVNCLTLEGDDHWHVGGSRLYFRFAIGEIVQESFFYSYYNEHYQMHQNTKGQPTIEPC